MSTTKVNQNPDGFAPMMVKSPYSGDYINVLPLFERMHECGFTANSEKDEMVKTMQYIHDRTSTTAPSEGISSEEWAAVNQEILQLRRMFERICIVKA